MPKNRKNCSSRENDVPAAQQSVESRTAIFNTSDPTPVAVKVIIALAGPLEERQREIEALRNGTHFGCNGIIRKNYTKGHDRMEIICLYRTGKNLEKITHEARMMLKRLNKWLNRRLKWDNDLVRLAYEELMHTRSVRPPQRSKGNSFDFKTSDPTPMEVLGDNSNINALWNKQRR
ncbi:hypothetical protein OSTOST_19263 [Ostertagia ostertagi]